MEAMFDSPYAQTVADNATQIKADGYSAVGLYLFKPGSSSFKQLLTADIVKTVHAAGLYIVTIWESGEPISADYFSTDRGNSDAHIAAPLMDACGMPVFATSYFTVDYDASPDDLPAIDDYFVEVNRVLGLITPTYTEVGVYGSGLVCQYLKSRGRVKKTWLSQSTGYYGYINWKPQADIVQGPSANIYGMDIDLDHTNGNSGGWLHTQTTPTD